MKKLPIILVISLLSISLAPACVAAGIKIEPIQGDGYHILNDEIGDMEDEIGDMKDDYDDLKDNMEDEIDDMKDDYDDMKDKIDDMKDD